MSVNWPALGIGVGVFSLFLGMCWICVYVATGKWW